MFTATSEALNSESATHACPAWCESIHADPQVEDHIRLVDAVHRNPHLESVAIELELSSGDNLPLVVLSLFTKKKKARAMSAGLSIDEARQAHAALGVALRLASNVPCSPSEASPDLECQSRLAP